MGITTGKACYKSRYFGPSSKSRRPRYKKNFQKKRRLFKRFFGSRFFLIFFGIVGFSLLLYIIFWSNFFSVQNIEVIVTAGGQELDAEVLTQEVRKRFLGKNLLFVSANKFFFLSEEPAIKDFSLKKNWPNQFEVLVTKRVGRAVLLDSKQKEFLVDEEGVVFAPVSDSDLLVISYPSKSLAIGDKVQGRAIQFVLAVLSSCSEAGLEVDSVRAAGNVVVEFMDGPQVLLPLENSAITRMVTMVSQFRSEGEPVSKIDLRFKNPVVEYKE
ncbi:MAG: cell division protein FtsQ/DivIB [Patescibacteria group bacterium]|nr:cell division protein FtsQ/DivIB [Patescibacteria group bacterium]